MEKIIEIPEGYEARIEGNKVILELKESEDEQIRKEIIFLLKNADSGEELTTLHSTKEMIAYLEEHKESTWTAEDESFVKHILPRILNPDMWTLDQRTADKKYLTEFIERQKRKFTKEQKPAEWSEEDTCILEDAVTAVDLLGNDDEYSKTHPNLAKAFRVAKNWLKCLPERFNLQPKQEWSEDDKKMVESIIETLSWYSLHTRGAEQDVNKKKEWLALLLQRFEVTKDRESATRFLKGAGIMDENGELAEKYRSNAPQPNHNQERLEEIAAYLRYKGREDDADYIESLKKS